MRGGVCFCIPVQSLMHNRWYTNEMKNADTYLKRGFDLCMQHASKNTDAYQITFALYKVLHRLFLFF